MKIIYIILGFLSLFLAVIGIFLPVLPTTPLLLLAAALFFRSSPKLYQWLLSRPMIGAHIRNFRENRILPVHAKITTIALLWGTMIFTAFFVIEIRWLQIILLIIAGAVTIHLLRFKSK